MEDFLRLRAGVWDTLAALGFEEAEGDDLAEIALQNGTEQVKNRLNSAEIPKELTNLTVSVAVGEFLRLKKSRGELAGFDLETAVKTIEEGDTKLTFALGDGCKSPEQRLDELIDHLTDGRNEEIYRFRRLAW